MSDPEGQSGKDEKTPWILRDKIFERGARYSKIVLGVSAAAAMTTLLVKEFNDTVNEECEMAARTVEIRTNTLQGALDLEDCDAAETASVFLGDNDKDDVVLGGTDIGHSRTACTPDNSRLRAAVRRMALASTNHATQQQNRYKKQCPSVTGMSPRKVKAAQRATGIRTADPDQSVTGDNGGGGLLTERAPI